jgi:fucose 4-O-acetylase-like acetyltransferase
MLGLGLGLVTVARAVADMPYSIYAKSDFWLNSPALTLIKTGSVLAMLAVAYLWINLGVESPRWSVFRQLGTTSLLVYWVHIEIVYGRWFGIWKESMSVPQVLLYTFVLLALMTGLSLLQTRYTSIKSFLKQTPVPEPRRASGD